MCGRYSSMVHQEQVLHARSLREWGWYLLTRESCFPCAFSLTEPCFNNMTEYNALIIGLRLTQHMEVQYLEAYSDSKLIVNQVKREYEVCHEDLIPYHHIAIKLANSFYGFYINHMSRLLNTKADALAALAATLALSADPTIIS